MIFVVLFFGLGVDFAAHFALRVQANLDQDLRAGRSLRDTGPALAWYADFCGELSGISATAYPGLAELGMISAGGMVIAFVLTLSIIPAVLLRRPPVARARWARRCLPLYWAVCDRGLMRSLIPGSSVCLLRCHCRRFGSLKICVLITAYWPCVMLVTGHAGVVGAATRSANDGLRCTCTGR